MDRIPRDGLDYVRPDGTDGMYCTRCNRNADHEPGRYYCAQCGEDYPYTAVPATVVP